MSFDAEMARADQVKSLMECALQTADAREPWNSQSDAAVFYQFVVAMARALAQVDIYRDQIPIRAQTFVDDVATAVEALIRREEKASGISSCQPST